MHNEISFRPYNPSDFDAVQDIIRKTWGYDDLVRPDLAELYARIDLLQALLTVSFSSLAIRDGQVIGFIFGNLRREPEHPETAHQLEKARRALRKCGLIYSALYPLQDALNTRLLRKAGRDYPAELSFFALTEDARGLGIGRTLFQSFTAFLREASVPCFYLKTDSRCNYGFYDHLGLTRRVRKRMGLPGVKALQFEFYLYDNLP